MLCPAGAPFPQCGARGVPATLTIRDRMASATLTGIVPGTYAIAVFHDANGNGRLDTFLGIPREAFGFSNNPPVRPRAPRFAECSFTAAGKIAAVIDMKSVF